IVSNQKISGKLQASLFSSNNTTTYTPLTYPELIIQKDEIQKQAYIADANGIAALDLEDKTISVKAVESSKTKNSKLKTSNSKHNYEVVLGCFSILENANRLSEKLSAHNIPASVSGKHKGLYVVSIGASSKQQATETLSEIKSVVPKAWIKKAN